MPRYLLHAAGRDRPGIVAALTRALAALDCNLEESRMTILHGQFAVMLVLEASAEVPEGAIEARLAEAAEPLDLVWGLSAIGDLPDLPAGPPVVCSVHGADHPGIVARITEVLSERGANVVDLATRVAGAGGGRTYVMVLSLELGADDDLASLSDALEPVAAELGVHCSLAAGDADLL